MSLIRSNLEHKTVGSGVILERTIVLPELILSAQSSGRCSGFVVGRGRTIVCPMV